MKNFLTTASFFGLALAILSSTVLIGKASASVVDSLSVIASENQSIDENLDLSHHDCYYDTYGNLHCW